MSFFLTPNFLTVVRVTLSTFNGDFFALEVVQVAQKHFFPVAPVTDEAEIRERPLRRANLLLYFGQQVTCADTSHSHTNMLISSINYRVHVTTQ